MSYPMPTASVVAAALDYSRPVGEQVVLAVRWPEPLVGGGTTPREYRVALTGEQVIALIKNLVNTL